jgi:hypothetical protein
MLKLNFATFGKSFSAALCDQGSKIGPERTPALLFPILASGSRSRGAQTGHPCPPWAHLLGSLAHPGSGYSSNGSGPKTEMETAHVEIPISNELFHTIAFD